LLLPLGPRAKFDYGYAAPVAFCSLRAPSGQRRPRDKPKLLPQGTVCLAGVKRLDPFCRSQRGTVIVIGHAIMMIV
jgi:hypothetical protein